MDDDLSEGQDDGIKPAISIAFLATPRCPVQWSHCMQFIDK